jgi:hypothetical protein
LENNLSKRTAVEISARISAPQNPIQRPLSVLGDQSKNSLQMARSF